MTLSSDPAGRSFGGEVEVPSTPTICRLPDFRRHQLSAKAPPSIVRRRWGVQGRRRGGRDLGVSLLAHASNTYRAHDFAAYAYRRAAAQCRYVGGDECRSALIDAVLDLRRRPS